jgi:hypothetical protein
MTARLARRPSPAWVLALVGAAAVPAEAQVPAAVDSVEEIYIARSLRESRESPTPFCAPGRTGFGEASVEDRYSFWSVEVRGSDGRVTDAMVEQVGTLRACFGPLAAGGGSFFYAEGAFGDASFTGRGDCRGSPEASPEPGVGVTRCFMDLGELPAPYTAGRLTTNTVNSRAGLGAVSDPPGYTQPSIATVRLWKRR